MALEQLPRTEDHEKRLTAGREAIRAAKERLAEFERFAANGISAVIRLDEP